MENGKRCITKRRVPCKYSGQRWGAFTMWRMTSDTATRNSTATLGLRLRYHPIASRKSCLASGWNPNRSPLIGELLSKLPEHLLARDHLDLARSNIIHPAFDLFAPCLLNAILHRPFIEALNQLIDQQTALLSRKRQRLLQHLRNLRCHLCHDHLTSPFYKQIERGALKGVLLLFQVS